MGGIAVDEDGRTDVEGLLAAGECSCVSVHGSNRLGGNSLLETLVFGRRAGARAVEVAAGGRATDEAALARALAEVEAGIRALRVRRGGERQITIRREMQSLMTENVGLFREESRLAAAAATIAELRERYARVTLDSTSDAFNCDLVDALELGGMLELAEATAVGALARTESRGSHWRSDHEARDDENWMKHTLATRVPGGPPRIEYEDVIVTTYEPMERKY
jgi:succinate dehydrogenase / fumarate reductase flavoprotein subunit